MNKEQSLLNKYIVQSMVSFAFSIIVVSFVGWLVGKETQESGGMMSLAGEGLTYVSMMQLLLFSFVAQGIVLIVTNVIENMLALWRFIIIIVSMFMLVIFFAIVFQWFPTHEWESWASFLVAFTTCMILCSVIMILKTKLEDKKYQEQLFEYKSKQKEEAE